MSFPFNDFWSSFLPMNEPPASSHSKSEVVDAGKKIASKLQLTEEAIAAFRVAHQWRSSHVYPMRRVRHEIAWKAKKLGTPGIAVARLKRMQSIRKKIQRGNRTLYQIQDIGGCRIILPDMAAARGLLELFANGQGMRPLAKLDDYIAYPKDDGYRSFHAIFKFNGPDDDPTYQRHFIEAQIRTELQHAWATAVEAVGLFRNEDIKGGEGHPDWRRLFALASGEFAGVEGGGAVPGVSEDGAERRRELRELVRRLDALRILDGIREAINYSEFVHAPEARFYLIEYDYQRRRVEIIPQASLPKGMDAYQEVERGPDSINSVLVEVDQLTDLRHAYPNYFLDVGMFTERLRKMVKKAGRDPSISGWRPDLSWLQDWREKGR